MMKQLLSTQAAQSYQLSRQFKTLVTLQFGLLFEPTTFWSADQFSYHS